jgi:chaperonin GroEL
MLTDLQTVIGGTVITSDFEMSKFSLEDFGTCEKAIIQKNFTLIVENKKNKKSKETLNRISEIKNQISNAYSLADGEEDLLRYRLRQLSGGISILRVGAATESELIERYDRVDDALHATKAAMQEGILPGGGTALLKSAAILEHSIEKEKDSGKRAGLQIVRDAITEPFKQIIKNCNISHDSILTKISDQSGFLGYDSRNDVIGDMFEMGIIDPFKVVRCSVENAISAASMLMMVECCLVDEIIE